VCALSEPCEKQSGDRHLRAVPLERPPRVLDRREAQDGLAVEPAGVVEAHGDAAGRDGDAVEELDDVPLSPAEGDAAALDVLRRGRLGSRLLARRPWLAVRREGVRVPSRGQRLHRRVLRRVVVVCTFHLFRWRT
jgi:hypothetical protein